MTDDIIDLVLHVLKHYILLFVLRIFQKRYGILHRERHYWAALTDSIDLKRARFLPYK